MALSRAVSEINGDFSPKSQNFPNPEYFAPPLKEIVYSVQKTRMTRVPGRERILTISLAVWIQYTNVTDRRTDGHRATAKTALMHNVAR